MNKFGIFLPIGKESKPQRKWIGYAALIAAMILNAAIMRALYYSGYGAGYYDATPKPITVACKGGSGIELDMGNSHVEDPLILKYFIKAAEQGCYRHGT